MHGLQLLHLLTQAGGFDPITILLSSKPSLVLSTITDPPTQRNQKKKYVRFIKNLKGYPIHTRGLTIKNGS